MPKIPLITVDKDGNFVKALYFIQRSSYHEKHFYSKVSYLQKCEEKKSVVKYKQPKKWQNI